MHCGISMKIAYIHQYFKTPEEGGAIRSYHLAKKLVSHGHKVEMITAHNHGKEINANIEGIAVHYLPVFYHNHFGFAKRCFSFLKFMLLSYRLIKKLGKIDLVYATSTPLTVGLLALILRRRLKIPYFFEVRDLWPDAPVQIGAIRNKLFIRVLSQLERKIYDNSEGIIALSPTIKSIIESRTNQKVYLGPNFADLEFFRNGEKDDELAQSLHIGKNFVIAYTGAVGLANGLESLIELAGVCLKKKLPIKFLIIGDGARLQSLKIEASNRELHNIIFVPSQNKYNLQKYLSLADAAYISFAKPKILETGSPNKFFDALAAGKLIVYNKNGWIRDLIESHRCGIYADSENPDRTAEELLSFINNPVKLKNYQQNALRIAMLFSKDKMLGELVEIVENCGAAGR